MKDTISIEYIKQLHVRHEEWLLKLPNVMVLDGNLEFEGDADR